jgi:hypothetical protein
MRSSISAQSWLSVPPAPGWMVTMASRASFSPGKQHGGFDAVQKLGKGFRFAFDIAAHVFAFAGQFEQRIQVVGERPYLLVVGDGLLPTACAPASPSGCFRVGTRSPAAEVCSSILASFCFCVETSKIPPHGQGLFAEGYVCAFQLF